MALEFKRNKLNVKDGSGDFVEIPVLGEQKTEKATVGELAIEVSRATAAEEAIAARVDKLQKVVGSPFVAATAASMTNTDRVYVYTGSETGYTAGNWYYYDGTAWVSGGVYNSAGVNVDDTLTYEGMAADAKATGDEISNVKNAFTDLNSSLSYNLLTGASWELGSVNGTTGADSWSNTRIRTGYIPIPTGATILTLSCDSGWKYMGFVINDDKTAVTASQDWTTAQKTIDLTSLATGNKGYFRYVLQRTNNTIDLADYTHAHTNYLTTLTQTITDCVGNVATVSASDIMVYFGLGGNPSISDVDVPTITVTLTESNLIIYDAIGKIEFTPANILSAASTFGLTTDSEARTFAGSVFRFVYNYKTRAISFKNPYAKIGQYEVDLLTRIYDILISGVIYDIVVHAKTETNENNITTIQETIYPQVPSYYDTQIATVKANVESDLQTVGRHGDNFVFITDIHWSGNFKHSPELIKSLAQGNMVNLIVNGGDLIDGSTGKATELARQISCIDAFNDAGIPMITAKGNHDLNSGYGTSSNYFTEEEYFATAQHQNALEGMVYGGDCYFYWDKQSTNTRYIVLDSGVNNIGSGIGIPAAQTSWITSVIGSTPADMHIIVVVHALGRYQYTDVVPSEENPFIYSTGVQDLLDALDGLLSTHLIEAVFFGHTHYDANYFTTGGIPLISTNSDAKHQYYGMTQPSDGTVDAQCFDVVTIDYTAKKIYLRRVGRGSDRTISY